MEKAKQQSAHHAQDGGDIGKEVKGSGVPKAAPALKKTGEWFIGTSGWQYRHWKGVFYPEEVKQKDWLGNYAARFKTVELNSSFYHQPKKEVFAGWAKKAAPGFEYAVKAPRFFTHLKKLDVTKEDLDYFLDAAGALGSHLGPLLFQLPPKWQLNLDRLAAFLQLLPRGLKVTFEFRDATWYEPALYSLLTQYDSAFCIYELGGHRSPVISTASFCYIRLHGPGAKYRGKYTDAQLEQWADQILTWSREGKDVYLFFDNDDSGYAPANALTLIKLLDDFNNQGRD